MKYLMTLCALGFASVATAHSPYLLPNRFDASKRDHVSVQGSFTEHFFTPDVAMKSDDYHVVLPDGSKLAVAPVYTKDVAVLDVATTQDGTYRLSTGNRQGRTAKAALLPDGTWKFFGEDGGAPADGKVHDVRSITRADAFVSRGTPTNTAIAPTGKGIEFEYLTHPNKLLAGASAKVRVLYDGKPVPNQLIVIRKASLEAGDSAGVEIRSGADGGATLPLATPGLYHVMARYRFALPGAEAKAESHTIAVTLEVTE